MNKFEKACRKWAACGMATGDFLFEVKRLVGSDTIQEDGPWNAYNISRNIDGYQLIRIPITEVDLRKAIFIV